MNKRSPTVAALVAVCCLNACGMPDSPEHHALQLPIIDGVQDEEHHGVVWLYTDGYICTGTLIGRQVVLTAAHCLVDKEPGDMVVYLGSHIYGPYGFDRDAKMMAVTMIHRHPGYVSSPRTKNDIALLRLSLDAPKWARPIPWLPSSRALSQADLGRTLTLYGYGRRYPDDVNSVGVRMKIDRTIYGVCDDLPNCAVYLPEISISVVGNTVVVDGGACYGDSGGPALIELEGEEFVAGVASQGDTDCDNLVSIYTRVDAFEDFIHEHAAPDGAACQDGDSCLSGLCRNGICATVDEPGCGCQTRAGSASLLILIIIPAILPRRRCVNR